MELARSLVRWLSGSPPTQSSGLAAFLSQQRDARPAVLPNAPTYGHRQLVSQLPAHVVARSGRRRVCAAYRVSCVRGARPMRASLALASGEGGLGLGHPMPSADGLPAWRLRPADFCKPPPPELGRLPSSMVKVPQHGSCASSGHAWRLWAARKSQEEAGPLGAQPLPQVLERAASKAADFHRL